MNLDCQNCGKWGRECTCYDHSRPETYENPQFAEVPAAFSARIREDERRLEKKKKLTRTQKLSKTIVDKYIKNTKNKR